MNPRDKLPIHHFETQETWHVWLSANHAAINGIWMKFAKKGSGLASVSYAEAVESALCWGWTDGQVARLDERFWLQRFTPRRPRSKWSKRNRQKATELIESGRMEAAGMRQVEKARADGRWEAAYDSPRTMTVPADFQEKLEAHPKAQAFFETLTGANRYAMLFRIQDAKRPETRARRIESFIAMLNEGRTIH